MGLVLDLIIKQTGHLELCISLPLLSDALPQMEGLCPELDENALALKLHTS